MISLLPRKYYKPVVCFVSGLIAFILTSLIGFNQKLDSPYQVTNDNITPIVSEFTATHLEPNFYQ
jgi:hypothetical protein